jgi:hypothetical protein
MDYYEVLDQLVEIKAGQLECSENNLWVKQDLILVPTSPA